MGKELLIPRMWNHLSMIKTSVLFIYDFLKCHLGWTMNFTFAHILFWNYGYDDLKEYGYSDKFGPEGNIPSGPLGSGNVIIPLLLVIVMSAIWLEKLMTHETGKANDIGIDEDDL